jgi:hypothetical protein
VLSIQPGGVLEADEELRAVGVRAGVGHRQDGALVSNLEVLTNFIVN